MDRPGIYIMQNTMGEWSAGEKNKNYKLGKKMKKGKKIEPEIDQNAQYISQCCLYRINRGL